jgi:hypothetical protein
MNIGDAVFPYYRSSWDQTRDIVWIYYTNHYIDCHFLVPFNQDFYLGFKKVKGNQIKVGWIKFKIYTAYGKELFISESAIQQ